MKIFLIFLLVLFNIGTVLSQRWAPVGAKWWYSSYALNKDNYVTPLESIGDTIIQGKNCKVIQSIGIGGCTFGYQMIPIYIYSDTSKVFYFNSNLNQFCLLYDFDKLPGEIFYIKTEENDSVGFLIDSIGYTIVDSSMLKVQYVTTIFNFNSIWIGSSGRIIEGLGHSSFLFPINRDACDDSWTVSILCYSDQTMSYHNPYYSSDLCSTIDIKEVKNDIQFKVFPNPISADQNLNIIFNYPKKCPVIITIYNIIGELMFKTIVDHVCQGENNIQITNIEKLSVGVYLVKISSDNFTQTANLINS